MINAEGFQNALYMIDIGQNDLADSFSKNLSYVQVIKRIPSIIREIENAVKVTLVIQKSLAMVINYTCGILKCSLLRRILPFHIK